MENELFVRYFFLSFLNLVPTKSKFTTTASLCMQSKWKALGLIDSVIETLYWLIDWLCSIFLNNHSGPLILLLNARLNDWEKWYNWSDKSPFTACIILRHCHTGAYQNRRDANKSTEFDKRIHCWSLVVKLSLLFRIRITKITVFNPLRQTVAVGIFSLWLVRLGRGCFSKWWTKIDWYGMPFVTMVLYTKCLSQTTEFEQKENCVLLQQAFFSSLSFFVFCCCCCCCVHICFSFSARNARCYCFLPSAHHS